jgi:hypothetical protein
VCEGVKLLGQYEKFPQTIHGVGSFTYKFPARELQKTILQIFHRLNRETYDMSEITHLPSSQCKVSFEVGIAEDIAFNFLDGEELERTQKSVEKNTLQILDFFCIARYHVIKVDGKRVPLKFDHYFLRFIFYQRELELRIVHERGTQHIHLEDFIDFAINQINNDLSKRKLEALGKRYLRAL